MVGELYQGAARALVAALKAALPFALGLGDAELSSRQGSEKEAGHAAGYAHLRPERLVRHNDDMKLASPLGPGHVLGHGLARLRVIDVVEDGQVGGVRLRFVDPLLAEELGTCTALLRPSSAPDRRMAALTDDQGGAGMRHIQLERLAVERPGIIDDVRSAWVQ